MLRQLLLLLLLRRRRMASYRRDALLGHGPVSFMRREWVGEARGMQRHTMSARIRRRQRRSETCNVDMGLLDR